MVPLWQVRWRGAGDLRMELRGATKVLANLDDYAFHNKEHSVGAGTAVAQKHWASFMGDCQNLSRYEYRKAIQELESLAECHRMALDEEEEEDV